MGVELQVSVEIEADSPLEALKIADKNRGGLQDLNWEDGNWESSVMNIRVVDPKDWNKVLLGEADLKYLTRRKK